MLSARSALVALAVSATVAPPVAASIGCGGCYVDDTVSDLRTDPEAACVTLAASEVNPCDGDYSITVNNGCTEVLILGGKSLPPRSEARFAESTGTAASADGRHALEGTLGATPVRVSWLLVSPD